MFLSRIKLSNVSLECLSHFFSLNLVKDNTIWESWSELIKKLLHWTMDWLKSWEGEEFKGGKKECSSKWKDMQSCVRDTATHGARMLYLSLRNDTGRAIQYSEIANDLLDLLIYSDDFFGLKAATSFLVSIKPWIPDIFISISSSVKAMAIPMDASLHSFYGFSNDQIGKRLSRPWVASFTKSAYEILRSAEPEVREEESRNPQEEGSSANTKRDKKSCFSVQFLNEVSKLLRRGDSMVLEGISSLFLWQALMSFKVEDYANALGALDIVYTRLLSPRRCLKITLSETNQEVCEEINQRIDGRMEEGISNSDDEQKNKILQRLKELVKNLLMVASEA